MLAVNTYHGQALTRGRPPPTTYQSVGHGLLPVIQVHEVVVVAGGRVRGHSGSNGEQEALAVPWK